MQTLAWMRRAVVLMTLVLASAGALRSEAQSDAPASEPEANASVRSTSRPRLAVLPFRLNSADAIGFLGGSVDEVLAERIEASGELEVVLREDVGQAMAGRTGPDLSDRELREAAATLAADAIVSGSLTELAGRFSLDVRVTKMLRGQPSSSLVLTANSDRELLGRLDELSERIIAAVAGGVPDRIVDIRFDGADSLEPDLRALLSLRKGAPFDQARFESDRALLASDLRVANVEARSQQVEDGVVLLYSIVRSDRILGEETRRTDGRPVAEVVIRGNQRIEEEAILTRVRTVTGDVFDPAQVARDVRAIFAQGFFSDIRVLREDTPEGVRVIFEVQEFPVIREISISGNDNVDGDDIRDALTLTTGSTLDYPLLIENRERVIAVYRTEGFYLAEVSYEIEEITEGSVAINFDVIEKEKLRLRDIRFSGNEAFTDDELRTGFTTQTWRFYSWATSWFDKTGTYAEPIFLRDLRLVEKKYTDNGFVQSRVSPPEVEATEEEGIVVNVTIEEGPQFSVGELSVQGDATIDLDVLREKIRLENGAIFSRSDLTSDVEVLEAHYTDRGFFFANVSPITQTNQDGLTVDVDFVVEKGPLYFVRNIDINGNTRTVDSVIRREIQLVEGQLYSARSLQVSSTRIRRLGYFEDVAFEPNTTEDPSQLDLDVNVVERPTGAFSFGAGFSSADSFIFTASLSQSNFFGRGYGANISADIGGNSSRYFVSLTDPYFLGTTFSFSATAFLTEVEFDDFEQSQQGVEFAIGHPLNVENTASGSLRYGYSRRKITQDTGRLGDSAPILRQVLQGRQDSSRLGVNVGIDTRNDRFAPTEGYAATASIEYAGFGGFANYLRFEGRAGYYLGAPNWLFDRSTFVISTRLGYAIPFNSVNDYDLAVPNSAACADPSNCINSGNLNVIDNDVKLPLTERYFLGGLGNYRLRGYDGRSVGPRRPVLRFTDTGAGRVYHPVGTKLQRNPATNELAAVCDDQFFSGNLGNGNGKCNSVGDKKINDFDDIDETDVIGGSSFISSSFEYRFPISEEIGLMGIGFIDGGNAFAEGEVLFDASEWRYGYGGGVLWFSPFGPLQLVLGFPINPRSFEDSPVFEFSVGGLGI